MMFKPNRVVRTDQEIMFQWFDVSLSWSFFCFYHLIRDIECKQVQTPTVGRSKVLDIKKKLCLKQKKYSIFDLNTLPSSETLLSFNFCHLFGVCPSPRIHSDIPRIYLHRYLFLLVIIMKRIGTEGVVGSRRWP